MSLDPRGRPERTGVTAGHGEVRYDLLTFATPDLVGDMVGLEPLPGDLPDDFDESFDPDRLQVCGYWRCELLFEAKSTQHLFCRKACRSRQRKWERSVARKERRAAAKRS